MWIVQCEMFLILHLGHTEIQPFKIFMYKLNFNENLWPCIIFTIKGIPTWGTVTGTGTVTVTIGQ